ncbi:MAG: glycoside hydrolase family 3 N-terminal domain-containing protein [Lachnospiraceae bacterium]|jgi:beta-glucosidase
MEHWTRARFTPSLPLGEHGKRLTLCRQHRALAREAAKEGMILLKNEHQVLPLSRGSRIALFGKGTIDYVKGGGGSGDVYTSYVKNLADGFEELEKKGQVSLFDESIDFYRDYVGRAYAEGALPGLVKEPEIPADLLTSAAAFTDTAVVSISRFSGEGWDRKSDAQGEIELHACDDKNIIEKSAAVFTRADFYLTEEEQAMLKAVESAFPHVVIVMNVGGMVDLTFAKSDENIEGLLLALQGGMEGGSAAAELLCGIGSPSGHLVDTFGDSLEAYPSTATFHEATDHVDYTEDIYVGYRYFETLKGAEKHVVYPFGFGLSYTDFDISEPALSEDLVPTGETDPEGRLETTKLSFTVTVTNVGPVAGKDVVQLYASAPQGLLGKPARVLVSFHKTRLLQPGESETVRLSILVDDLASFDDMGRIRKSAYVLEKGDYLFFLGENVEDAKDTGFTWSLPDNVITSYLTSKCAPTSLSMRLRADGSFESLPLCEPNDPNESGIGKLTYEETIGLAPDVREQKGTVVFTTPDKPQLADVAEGKLSLSDFVHALPDEDLADLLGGQVNTGCANTFGIGNNKAFGIPNLMTADGPAGIRFLPETGVKTTAFPCATLLCSSWNPEITNAVGQAQGEEAKENNICCYLSPAVNIHRSPLCGRNFEYWSEDPLLAGKLAASLIRGIQSTGVSATVKHFACNNKETNRINSDSRVSERALREIYLKQFEIIVKEARPHALMTSYNLINGHRASENRELLTGILRREWGYEGLVMTDWWNDAEQYKEVKAGCDLKMPRGYVDRLLTALEKGLVTRSQMELAAKHILQFIINLDNA